MAEQQQALAPAEPAAIEASEVVTTFERLARDPNVDVDKLERLIQMQERIMKHQARQAYYTAFRLMQRELPEIRERGKIAIGQKVQSTYALNEDIQRILRPILDRHGFALAFRTNTTEKGDVRTVAVLTHEQGHSEETEFTCGPDTSGNKNSTQALGSARAYGMRYTTIALLNVITIGDDDDGKTAQKPEAPKGYAEFANTLGEASRHGLPALREAFKKGNAAQRDYLTKHDADNYEDLKAAAEAATEAAQ